MDNVQLIENLTRVLAEELKLYKSILDISKRKTRVIIDGNIDELNKIVKGEHSFVLKVGKLEDLRGKLVFALSKKLGISFDNINVSEIIKRIDENEAKKIEKYKEFILKVVNELKDVNEINGKLIKNSLEFIDFSINLVSNIDDGSNNYCNTGNAAGAKKRTYFDAKY